MQVGPVLVPRSLEVTSEGVTESLDGTPTSLEVSERDSTSGLPMSALVKYNSIRAFIGTSKNFTMREECRTLHETLNPPLELHRRGCRPRQTMLDHERARMVEMTLVKWPTVCHKWRL